jgi:hypothetical protein
MIPTKGISGRNIKNVAIFDLISGLYKEKTAPTKKSTAEKNTRIDTGLVTKHPISQTYKKFLA